MDSEAPTEVSSKRASVGFVQPRACARVVNRNAPRAQSRIDSRRLKLKPTSPMTERDQSGVFMAWRKQKRSKPAITKCCGRLEQKSGGWLLAALAERGR